MDKIIENLSHIKKEQKEESKENENSREKDEIKKTPPANAAEHFAMSWNRQ